VETNPKISVVIPVHNRESELKRAIHSVLNQTEQGFEIHVIDDASVINIKAIVEEFNDARIIFHRVEKKSNANVCRNIGIKAAKANYIAMLDSDDEWMENHLVSKIAWLEINKADGVFGSHYINDGQSTRKIISRPFKENEKMIDYLLSDGSAVTPSQVYKTSRAMDIMWDEELNRHQDLDFSVRFANKYSFIPSFDPSCIVHWKKGEKRLEDFSSQMKFIDKNKKEISPVVYMYYHRIMYSKIVKREDISSDIKLHYQNESLKFMKLISFTDYVISKDGVNAGLVKKIALRFGFACKVIFRN
jgi:glycosyltransferase involved in cell wall biosynthesis